VNPNLTDKITILYNFLVIIFISVFWTKIDGHAYHLTFNLSVILLVLLLSLYDNRSSPIHLFHLWYPVAIYALLYYQTGLLNRVIIPRFLDPFFLNLDVRIFGKFPGFFLKSGYGNMFWDEFFHLSYFNYYLAIPVTGVLLHRKDERFFKTYIFQLSFLFYLCFLIYILLPVEGPIPLRDHYYPAGGGFFRAILDLIYTHGENPGAAFPSSHVAATFLVAWWGSKHFPKLRIWYWCVVLFLSIATVYCMYHYAVDVFAGLLLAVVLIFLFNKVGSREKVRESAS
jgi:membrane-associated phospholipid phosphatase